MTKTLNDTQQVAYDKIMTFLTCIIEKRSITTDYINLPNKFFLLDGAGGCGKTFIIKKLISNLNNSPIKHRLLAPTHKACNILRSSGIKHVETIAKFLGYNQEVQEDGTKKTVYKFIKEIYKDIDILIIDECSMISKIQVKMLLETNKPIIFVGDDAQLNPISEEKSEIYLLNFEDKHTLDKNMRSRNQELSDYIFDVRASSLNNKIDKHLLDNHRKIKNEDEFINKIKDSFLKESDTVVLAWTNKAVNKYCDTIRSLLFKKEVSEKLEKYYAGEKLSVKEYFVYQTNGAKKFYTNDIIEIKKVEITEVKVFYPRCMCEDSERIGKKCDQCFTKNHKDPYKIIKFYKLYFEDDIYFFSPYDETNEKELNSVLLCFKDRCKELSNSIKLETDSKKIQCLKERAIREWKAYYWMVIKYDAPLNYTYSMTVHKAQGSGYKNVFVHLSNIYLNRDLPERCKMIYTAFSRASEELSFYNF